MPEADLHPAPVPDVIDHREAHNRAQLQSPSELHSMWRRVVDDLAAQFQIEPIEAHFLLRDAGDQVSRGLAFEWWLT